MGGPVTARMEHDLPDVVLLTRRRWRRRGRQSCWRRRHRQRPLPPLGLKSIRWIFSQTVGRFDSIAGIQLDKRNSVALEMDISEFIHKAYFSLFGNFSSFDVFKFRYK
ncbi:hypothetical protein K1719_030913 [Acacia pycnantha]|nr:hypothetical protein K1719_030913 [Acacia pycnantha]